MFRENDFPYLVAALAVVFGFTVLSIWYEVAIVDQDSKMAIVEAIIRWQGVILPVTIISIAVWEVFTVIANRMIAHFRQEDRQQGRKEERVAWEEWNARRLNAENRGEQFHEPTPGEKERVPPPTRG